MSEGPITNYSVSSPYFSGDWGFQRPKLFRHLRTSPEKSSLRWKDDMLKATKLEKAVKSVVESSLGQGRADALMYEEGLSNDYPA